MRFRKAGALGHRILLAFALLLLLGRAAPADPAKAALWWFQGVRDSPITVCFAGDAVTTRPARVTQMVGYIQHFEFVANIQFITLGGQRLVDEVAAGNLASLACPAPTTQNTSGDYYAGDIRVAITGTDVDVDPPGKVPGTGCIQDKVGSSYSNPPQELELKRACQYNLKLGDDGDSDGVPWLNHTLHEFGHGLGLSHEHARDDEDAGCVPSSHDDYHAAADGFMTPYDKDSVMHYWWPATDVPGCQQTGSNYSHTGLTEYDKLGLHILYPEANRVAEFVGRRVIRSTDKLDLRSAWKQRGANLNFVANSFAWKIDGKIVGTNPDLYIDAPLVGKHTLEYSYRDFLDRQYTYTGELIVLTPDAYKRRIASAVIAGNEALFVAAVDTTTALAAIGGSVALAGNVMVTIEPKDFGKDIVLDYKSQTSNVISGFDDVGILYDLSAMDAVSGQTVQPNRGQSYEIVLTYNPSKLSSSTDESALALYELRDGVWQREATSQVNPAANQITAMPTHFSRWAILAPQVTASNLYLPNVTR